MRPFEIGPQLQSALERRDCRGIVVSLRKLLAQIEECFGQTRVELRSFCKLLDREVELPLPVRLDASFHMLRSRGHYGLECQPHHRKGAHHECSGSQTS